MIGDKYFYVNSNDPDLKEIRVEIAPLIKSNAKFWNPEITESELELLVNPPLNTIRNYNKKRKDQYWTRIPVPERLVKLEKSLNGDQRKIWEELSQHANDFEKEIEYIKNQWFHRIYGEWIMINEVPTWISPWHWFFLSYWTGSYEVIDRKTLKKKTSKYAEYRDRDRRKFNFTHYAYTCTETFEKLDAEGRAIPEPDGTYKMIDLGIRVCLGRNYPKHRRDGATQNDLSTQYHVTTMVPDLYSSIIANKPNTQKKHFETKVVPAWRRMPFYFKPIHDGSDRPKRALNFFNPAIKQKDGNVTFADTGELGSILDFADIVDRAYYDHAKITGILVHDEGGKCEDIDVFEGYNIIKPAMGQGGGSTINPYAFMLSPSTVEEMEHGGGRNFKMLCDASDYYKRSSMSGQTQSGLWNMFFPSFDGLENFIGPYGESIIDDPTPEQAKFIGRNYGSKKFIENKIDSLRRQNTPQSLRELEQFTRQHPMCWADCWRMMGGDLGFNMEKLHKRREELKRLEAEGKDPRKKAYFVWMVPGEPNGLTAEEYLERRMHLYNNQTHRVELRFAKDNEPFDFYVTKTLQPEQTNMKVWNNDLGYWCLLEEPIFVSSADPVQYLSKMDAERREDKAKASYAAAACFYRHRPFDDSRDESERESNRFVCTYMSKDDSVELHGEKMLMMCIYYNSEMFPEKNVKETVRWFEQRLYSGYLKRAWLAEEYKYASHVGYQSQGKTLNSLFRNVRDYIEYHIYKEEHLEIIEQYIKIKSKEQMTSYDLFPATAGCLLAQKLSYVSVSDMEFGDDKRPDVNIEDWYGEAS